MIKAFRLGSSPLSSPLLPCSLPRAGKYELQLVAMCDSYVGVDRTVPITLKVSALTRAALDEREARNAKVKQWESDEEEEEGERKAKAKGGSMGQRQGPAARALQTETTGDKSSGSCIESLECWHMPRAHNHKHVTQSAADIRMPIVPSPVTRFPSLLARHSSPRC